MWGAKGRVGAMTQNRQGAAPPGSTSHSRIGGLFVHMDTYMYAWWREAAVTESFSATNTNVLSLGNPYAYLWHL